MAVKSHQAFFLAARTNHAAGLVPTPGHVPALFPSTLSPPRSLPVYEVDLPGIVPRNDYLSSSFRSPSSVFPARTAGAARQTFRPVDQEGLIAYRTRRWYDPMSLLHLLSGRFD
jgi:hypothetical protein